MVFRPCIAACVGLVGLVPGTAYAVDSLPSPGLVAVASAKILRGLDLGAVVHGTSMAKGHDPDLSIEIRVRSVDADGASVPKPHLGTRALIVLDLP